MSTARANRRVCVTESDGAITVNGVHVSDAEGWLDVGPAQGELAPSRVRLRVACEPEGERVLVDGVMVGSRRFSSVTSYRAAGGDAWVDRFDELVTAAIATKLAAATNQTPTMSAQLRFTEEMLACVHEAIRTGQRIAIYLRANLAAGTLLRVVEGVPVGFRSNARGEQLAVLRIAEGAEQRVLVDRIVRVLPAA